MPAQLYLQQFGMELYGAFGEMAYHVGSSLTGQTWRDVDVRVMFPAEKYQDWGLGNPIHCHSNARWRAFTMAFSALGRQMTGLPIDFQIQQMEDANTRYADGQRSALFIASDQPA